MPEKVISVTFVMSCDMIARVFNQGQNNDNE